MEVVALKYCGRDLLDVPLALVVAVAEMLKGEVGRKWAFAKKVKFVYALVQQLGLAEGLRTGPTVEELLGVPGIGH